MTSRLVASGQFSSQRSTENAHASHGSSASGQLSGSLTQRIRYTGNLSSAAALALSPVVDFDRRDDLQTGWLIAMGASPTAPPRHYVPSSNDFARAVRLGLGWGLLPQFQSAAAVQRGDLVHLGGAPADVPLYWQQWNLRSALPDAVANEVVAEGRRVLR